MGAKETAGPEGQRARASIRDGTIPNPQSGGLWEVGAGRALVSVAVLPGVRAWDPARARLHQPGLLQKGEGRARGLAHVRRVWRVAVV